MTVVSAMMVMTRLFYETKYIDYERVVNVRNKTARHMQHTRA